MFTSVVTALFLLAITVQMGYALYFFGHIFNRFIPEKVAKAQFRPLSVIICARNEAANLRQNLPSILSQRYMNEAGKTIYEVVVVNDASDDDTETVLNELGGKYANLKIITTNDNERKLPGKKYAVHHGVAAASHELLVMTDADCCPASEYWLERMVMPLLKGKQIVAGIGKYYHDKGILNAFIRWETMHTFLQYVTYTAAGRPYMAVGRNMACTKATFLAAEQSYAWNKLPSGDDDLLVNNAGNDENTGLVTTQDAFTVSPSKATWGDWIKQKQRHLSTGKYYQPAIVLLLGIYACAHALMWLTFFVLLFTGNWLVAAGVMVLRCIVYWMIWMEAAKKMQDKDLVKYFLLFDIGWMIYNFAFSPYILFKNKQTWK